MKSLAALLLVLLASCGTTRLTAMGGMAELDSDQQPVEQPSVVGLEFSQAQEGGGFGYEVGGHYGEASGQVNGVGTNSESYEFYGGARYELHFDWFQPYLSGGITEVRIRSASPGRPTADDSDLGYYASLGADFAFGSSWYIGLAARRTFDIDGQFNGPLEGSADGWQYFLRLGMRF